MMSYTRADQGVHTSKQPNHQPNHPYSQSLASSASTSTSSIFSLAPQEISAASSTISLHRPDHNTSQSSWGTKDGGRHSHPILLRAQAPLPAEQRQHPRRTTRLVEGSLPSCMSSEACNMPAVPPLVREIERKLNFVDNLVDAAAQIVETVWAAYMKPDSSSGKSVLPLKTFIQETLRRSRTSYSTLQVALYYLLIIRDHILSPTPSDLTPEAAQRARALRCGRRMFLAALILASKYLQDRNYSARAWSRISGLQTTEININEVAFLETVNWRLHISERNFLRWTDLVNYFSTKVGTPEVDEARKQQWCSLVLILSPDISEALPILREKAAKEGRMPWWIFDDDTVDDASSDLVSARRDTPLGVSRPAETNCDSSDARITPRPSLVSSTVPTQKVTVSSLLSDPPSVASPLKAPAARLVMGTSSMACAAAAAQVGQLQRCATEDMGMVSRRTAVQRRSSLSTSISSPESSTDSDSSANSSPSRFPLSRSSSISSASSMDSIIPSRIAAQCVSGRKFARVQISCKETILETESSPAIATGAANETVSTGLNTPTPSPRKNLVFRLKPTAAPANPLCCPRKRQRGCEHEMEMNIDAPENTSGVTPHLQIQLQMRTPPDGAGFKRLRCGTQEASTMLSIHGYRGNEEVS